MREGGRERSKERVLYDHFKRKRRVSEEEKRRRLCVGVLSERERVRGDESEQERESRAAWKNSATSLRWTCRSIYISYVIYYIYNVEQGGVEEFCNELALDLSEALAVDGSRIEVCVCVCVCALARRIEVCV
jgi:hypothetical protein